MPPQIEGLLTTPDNVEIIRDQIAAILTVEFANQATLGLSPAPRVFLERSNPWGVLHETPESVAPVINVWFDTETFNGSAGSTVDRQAAEGTFNVDVYGFAASTETPGGHTPGDEQASLECQKYLRLCRQILMSAHYTYLGLRGVVWKRWPQTIGMFRPPTDDRSAINIVAGRLALVVTFNEFAPQFAGEPLETLSLEVRRAESGELYFEAEYSSLP